MLEQTFVINNDEIARGEYFSHSNEPMFTFYPARNMVYVNSACLKRLPNLVHALFAISTSEKRLSVLPCDVSERDAIRLRSLGRYANRPRQVRCHTDFSDKLLSLMEWKRDCRYRMIGYVASGEYDTIIAFDLSAAEEFLPGQRFAGIPAYLSGGFGQTFDMRQNDPIIKVIEQDIEISMLEEKDNDCDQD